MKASFSSNDVKGGDIDPVNTLLILMRWGEIL
jgi:hypothetical protein